MISFNALRKMEIDPLWLLRIFTVTPVLLIVVAGAVILWIYFFALSLLPESQSKIDLPGLSAEVRVIRDARGIPGILGEKEEDVALVLGYVMAQDRLWQIDYLRRASQGRLAEILGRDYLAGDQLMRTIKTGGAKTNPSERLGERERAWLDGFVRGINAYISRHAGKLPMEFSLLEYRPEPFTADDVMGIFLALAWESSPASRVDPTMTRILGRLGPDRGVTVFPTDPAAAGGVVFSDLHGWKPEGILFSTPTARADRMRVPGFRGGCAWTVNKDKTRSGQPMAAWMVYQALAAPGFWYRARLVAGDRCLSGAFVPGLPVAFVGTNGHVAWGCISSPADDADLFIERLDSDSPKSYWRGGRWRALQEIGETYRIKGGSSVSRVIRVTETGPLVSEIHKARALSLRWTGRDGLGLFPTFYALNRSRSSEAIRAALESLRAPSLYVLWTDAEGGNGFQMAGRIPVRPPGSDGIMPTPAWTGVHDWIGFVPFRELPSVTDPADGAAIVTDGRPGGADYPLFLGCYWNDDGRGARIKDLLDQSGEHYQETFLNIQTDTLSPLSRDLVPLIMKAVNQGKGLDSSTEKAGQVLGSWDFRMNKESAGAALFALIYQSLVEQLFLESLGERDYRGFTDFYPLAARMLKKIFLEGNTGWLGETQPETILNKSFREAVKRGKSLMGSNPEKWQWGEIHTTTFVHPLTTRSRFLEMLYQVGPVSLPGSGDTIDLAGWSQVHPFHVLDGVSLRQISDMTHPPEMVAMSPMGSSAHFFSTHYKDQTQAWAKGRVVREPIERTDIKQNAMSAVIFLPGRMEKISQR